MTKTIGQHSKVALGGALVVTVFLFGIFLLSEPTIGRAVADQFTVSQNVTDEISFGTPAADVAMEGSIGGVTGGTATGTTYVVVQTNDTAGYNMTIAFDTAPAMVSTTTSDVIFDYVPSATSSDYAFTASSSAVFAYTVTASDTTDIAQHFKNNGSICGEGSGVTINNCWAGPSTTAKTIVNRTTASNAGATTTLYFKVDVPNGPVPTLDAAYYRATATLTALNN